ncbi:MAG: competence/damage-inducible protein A [Thermosynechococcaceae cyanobacterium MS004]|nr:competence/damage-inducible protein A [Thermosynechococcaceae cyanobacterium MS004]
MSSSRLAPHSSGNAPGGKTQSAEIICVGTELLLGEILNSNAQFLAQELAKLGIPHFFQTVVGDNPLRLKQAIAIACHRSSLLIFTGGLGPTPDDLTTETIADFFETPLVEHEDIWAAIEQRFTARGLTLSANNRKQAQLPQGAAVLPNPVGTAPGMIWQPRPGLTFLTFPGVPRELYPMWENTAIPFLKEQGWGKTQIYSRSLRFWGISESTLAEKVDAFLKLDSPTVAPYAGQGEARLRLSVKAASEAEAREQLDPIQAQIQALCGLDYYGTDQDSLASVVGKLLQARGETVAVAESCTGGGLGQKLTDVVGSSRYFWGGVIAYDNQVKRQVLQVETEVLNTQGAVSAAVAEQMAIGVKNLLGTTWGLSITGIAGPGGGSEEKPIGLVYVGLAGPHGLSHREYKMSDRGRDWVRGVSASAALDLLRRSLL